MGRVFVVPVRMRLCQKLQPPQYNEDAYGDMEHGCVFFSRGNLFNKKYFLFFLFFLFFSFFTQITHRKNENPPSKPTYPTQTMPCDLTLTDCTMEMLATIEILQRLIIFLLTVIMLMIFLKTAWLVQTSICLHIREHTRRPPISVSNAPC